MAARTLRLLLPAWADFGRQSLTPDAARALGRGDAATTEPGRPAQRARAFACVPAHDAPAALARQRDAGDAGTDLWLRADPAHARADINGARLLAYGRALALTREDMQAFLPALRPLFGDAGMALDAPVPDRWYLRLQPGATVPVFSEPEQALGEDLFEHQPQGEAGRRWRALSSEVEITLHNHPQNAVRIARGQAPVNLLWFWGAGKLPTVVRGEFAQVATDDEILDALAHAAGASTTALPARLEDLSSVTAGEGVAAGLVDLAHMRDLAALQRDWLLPALARLRAGAFAQVELDACDGRSVVLRRGHRLRFWRRPWMPSA